MRAVRDVQTAVGGNGKRATKALAATLAVWQEAAFPKLVQRPRALCSTSREIEALAELLSKLPFDEATFWLASAYAQWVGDDRRAWAAMFFTPPVLAKRLIDDLVSAGASLQTHRWCDPACGGAAFLAPVARRIADALRERGQSSGVVLRHIESHVFGNDIDPALADLSKQFLRMALYPEIVDARYEPQWRITVSDALAASNQLSEVDAVICNPPYRKMPSNEVKGYRDTFEDILQGQPNLYALFYKRCLSLVPNGGLVGLVTPTSFLSGQSFEKLRTYLLRNAETKRLRIVTEREGVFVGVEQEVAITVLCRMRPELRASETPVSIYTTEGGFLELGSCKLPNSGAAWPLPRDPSDAEIIRRLADSPFRLADYGYQPKIGWFVDYRNSKTYPPRTIRCANKAKQYLPLIWSSDIDAQGTLRINRLGRRNHKSYIELPKLHTTGIHRKPSVALQRVTSPDQPKRLVGAPISNELFHSGFVAENHVLVLEQLCADAAVGTQELVELLKATAIDRYFRCISGAVNVSVFELGQLPLPDPVRLRAALNLEKSMDDAVTAAFERSGSR